MGYVVGPGEIFETKTGRPLLVDRPCHTIRTQGIRHPKQVDNVPSRIALLPFPRVGIEEIAVQHVTGELVIESNTVEPRDAGPGYDEFFMNAVNEGDLIESFPEQVRHQDPRYHDRPGRGHHIVAGPAIEIERLINDVEREVRANTGKLDRAVPRGVDPGSLIVVPVDGFHRRVRLSP